MPQTIHTFKILLLVLVLAFGLQYASAAWVGPTATPPNANAPAPINVSDSTQEKDGGFAAWAGGIFTGNGVWANQYCNEEGENCSPVDELGGRGGITWFDSPIRVVDTNLNSRNWRTATISQVPANATAIFRVETRIPTRGQDEHHLYIRKKGSSFDGRLMGLNFLYNYAPDVIQTQVLVQVSENSQIEYRVGDNPVSIEIDLLGYME